MPDIITTVLQLHDRWRGMYQRAKHEHRSVDPIWHGMAGRERFVRWAIDAFKPHLVLDRRNNDLGYAPDNCQWVTNQENVGKEHRKLLYRGKLYNYVELAAVAKISKNCLHGRIKSGWTIEDAVNTPKSHGNRWRMKCVN